MTVTTPSVARATLPDIREADATGRVAEIYAEILRTQRGNNVNYIWRHLATIPGALEPAWLQVKSRTDDIHAFGEIIWSRARRLVQEHAVSAPSIETFPATAQAVLASYANGNRWNLAALSYLLGHPLLARSAVTQELSDTPCQIPALPAHDQLQDHLRASIARLAEAGPAADSGIRPSLWVHLAIWPDFLADLTPALADMLASSAFRASHSALLLDVSVLNQAPADLPDAAVISIRKFRRRIAEMTLVGATLETRC
jgi:hypothetical protein